MSNIKKKTVCRLLGAEKTVQQFAKNKPHLSNYPSNITKEQTIYFVAKEILVHEKRCMHVPLMAFSKINTLNLDDRLYY